MEAAVRRLIPLKAGRHTHLHVYHFKQWLQEVYPGEKSNTPPLDGVLDVPGGNCPAHVANGGYPTGVGVDFPGTHTKKGPRTPGA